MHNIHILLHSTKILLHSTIAVTVIMIVTNTDNLIVIVDTRGHKIHQNPQRHKSRTPRYIKI